MVGEKLKVTNILWVYESVDEIITWNNSIEDKTGHELERKKL